MAEKENEGRAAKLMRKLSRKSIKVPPSVPPPPPQEALPPAGVRSATLPISYDSRDLALHESHSESLFSKLRRRFRLGSKGKYDFKTSGLNSPTKPRWLRRRSEETQVQHEENSVCLDTDPKNAVGKSNSVRTQRKAKSDKEEVILIRKDKRVSVICKAENGASEVIFSNVDNPDEDLSEGLSEMDEDPYATISSVKQDITKNKLAAATQKNYAPSTSMPADTSAVIWKSDKVVMDSDEYPYAKIDSSRKKQLTLSQPSLQANNLSSCKVDTRVVSQIEPDYETLEDIKQKKMELNPQGNMFSASNHTASLSIYSAAKSSALDPDYESLEEVKQKSGSFNLPCHLDGSSMKQNGLTCLHSKGQISIPDKTMLEDSRISSQYSHSFGSCDMFPSRLSPFLGASLDRKRYSKTLTAASPQESLSSSLPSPHQEGRISSSASSLTPQAPLAPTVDSSLSQDTSSQVQTSAEEECIYDNPNIILRKQVSRSGTNVSSLTRRNHTHSEPPIIKTPAEEELVEKLSALLAPPLPLRNYQKDEVYSRSGAGSARHSWSSQGSRHVESGEIIQARNNERSPLASLSHSKENLIVKSGKDSLVSPAHDRHDLLSRSNGADLHRKKEIGHLEKYLRKASPQTVSASKLLDKNKSLKVEKSDYSTINKVKKKAEENTPQSEDITSNIKTSEKMKADKDEAERNEADVQSQFVHKSAITFFCHSLAENVIEEAMKECGSCESPPADLELEQFSCIDLKIVEEHDLVPVEEKRNSPAAYSETQHLLRSDALEKASNVRNIQCEENAHLTFSGSSENNQPVSDNIPLGLVCTNKATVLDASPTLQQKKNEAGNKMLRNLDTSNGKDENVRSGTNSSAAAYNLQGARPKVKHLCLEPAALTSESCARSVDVKSGPKPWSNGIGTSRSENGQDASVQLANDPCSLDFMMLPDLDVCDGMKDMVPSQREKRKTIEKEQIKRQEKEQNAKSFTGANIRTQITANTGLNLKNRNGVDLNKHARVQAKRNNFMRQMTDHVLFSNPRLFENVVSHLVNGKTILDKNYLAEGVFRWGRYFPCLDSSRHAVEMKLKAMFLFVVQMVFTPAWRKVNQAGVEEIQAKMDRLQIQIEKLLKDVKDFSNFNEIQHELISNDLGYEHLDPEFFEHKENHSEVQTKMKAPPLQDMEAGDILHSDDPYSQVDETFCLVGSGETVPNSPSETLEEFTKLSKSHLQCRYCSVVEESDSEDEMIATEVYAKTVSASFNPRVSSYVDYIAGGSFCRALHGELAYNAYIRKHRPHKKLLVAPGPDNECCGPESHLSWNNWCALDAMFKKLVPHISPRLDFHHLLRTYSEFKHFILIGRKRKLEHKGCFTIKTPGKQMKCSRFEEFVFLKIIRDEIRHFAHVLSMSESRRDLFLEERDIGFSLLSLLKLVLRNVHKMRRSMSKEWVKDLEGAQQSEDGLNYRVHFRHTAFQKWQQSEEHLVDCTVSNKLQEFHSRNLQDFFFSSLSMTLKNWKSPQAFVHDPNVLLSCRRVFSQSDPSSQSLELTGMRGEDEPRPLQEQQDFLESMEQLQWKEWYWGPISYEQATLILKDKEDGSFLVRDSSDQKYLLSLSFKSLGEVHHTRIEHAKGLFSFWSQPESHGKARICEFIEKSIQNSRDGRFLYFLRPSARGTPPLPIRLLTPVSRNFRVATLKHLSRFIVRQSVRKDHLDLLPVPEKVKRYLRDKQYYVEILDDDQWAFDGDYGKSLK